MKNFSIKITRIAITLILVLLGIAAIFKAWVFYTESPWTRDAKFTADVVAIAPDVSGLLTDVPVVDNQLVKKGQVLFVVDRRVMSRRWRKPAPMSPTIKRWRRKNGARPAAA